MRPFLWTGMVLVAIPAICLLLVHLAPVQKQIIDTLIRRVEASTGMKIEMASYRWSPFSGLEVEDFRISADGKPVVDGARAEVTYGLGWQWPFLHLREIYLEKPNLRLEKTPKGQWQLPGVRARKDGENPAEATPHWRAIPLPRLRVASGTITAEQDGKTILSVKDMTGTLSLGFVQGSDGPRISVDLGRIQGASEVPRLEHWAVEGRIIIDGESVQADQVSVELGRETRLSASARWMYHPPFDGEATIEIEKVSPSDLPAMPDAILALQALSGKIHLQSQSGRIFADHDLITPVGALKGSLRVDPQGPEKALRWIADADGFNLAPLFKQPETLLSGHIELTATAGATTRPEDLKATFSVKVQPSRVADLSILGGLIQGSCENGKLEIDGSSLRTSSGNLTVKADADFRGYWDPGHKGGLRLDLQVEQAALDRLHAKATQKLGGNVQLEAFHDAGEFRNWRKWRGKLETTLNIPDMLRLKAQVAFLQQNINGAYELDAPDMQRVSAFFPSFEGKGKISSHGTVKGIWPDLIWEGAVTSPAIQYGTLKGEQISATGKGTLIGKEARRELALKVQNVSAGNRKLGSLSVEVQQQDESLRAQVKGDGLLEQFSTRFSCQIDGVFSPQRTLVIRQGGISWKGGTASIDGKVEVFEGRVRIPSVVLAQGRQKVTLSGEVNRDGRSDVKMSLDQISAEQWLQTFDGRDVLKGTVSGTVQVSGRSDQPEATVNLSLSDGTLLGKERIRRFLISGSYARELLSLQGDLSAESMKDPAVFSARIPLRLSMFPFHFEVRTTADWNSSVKVSGFRMESLKAFIPGLERIEGAVDGEIHLGGTPAQPTVRGGGAWRNGRVLAAKWPHPVENIQIEWRADSKEFFIERGEADLLGGRIDLKGRASVLPRLNLELEATGQNVKAPEFYGISGTVSGPARLVVNSTGSFLTGNLHFSKAGMDLGKFESDLARNIKVVDGTSKGDFIEIDGDEKAPANPYNKFSMDLALHLPESGTFVHGKGLDTEISGGLKIQKDAQGPIRYAGRLHTIRGTYTFQGVSLDITEGELVFLGKARPDPNLRIVCQKTVRDALIRVQVTGPLKSPKLAMSSVPSMNQVDILSYLMYQQPAGQLNSRQTMQLQDRAAYWLGSETTNILKRVFGNNRFAPDTVEYRSATSRTDVFSSSQFGSYSKAEGGVVEIGKHITPDLYVNYGRGVMGEEGNQVQVEYRFNKNLSIQTQVGGTDQSGVDVFWRHDFGK